MPGRGSVRIGSGLAQLQRQAEQLLVNVRKEIRVKEAELDQFKDAESKLSGVFGLRATSGGGAAASRAIGGGRIKWGTVLEQLPKRFRVADTRKVRGLKDKRSSEIFAAITRWIEAGSVKRKERGLYERVQQSQPRSPKNTA